MSFGSLAHTLKTKFLSANRALDTKAGLAAPDPAMLALFGVLPSISGASVTPQSAMSVPAVAAAVGLISSTIGTLPAKVFTKLDTGGKTPAPDHAAYPIVHDDANEWTSACQLRSQLTADALLFGNGYAYANRVNGKVQEFIRLDPASVTPKIDAVTGEPTYEVKQGNTKRLYPFRDILHIPATTTSDGVTGIAPIHFAREAIALSITLEGHAAKLFGRGARPSGVLTFEKKLDPETAKRISESWHLAHSGEAAGKTAVLEEGGSFEPITFNSVDAQFAEMRRFQILEIARAFRVSPFFLMELERATWSNSEQMRLDFMQFTLLPWLRTWEAAYRRVLLDPSERSTTSIEFVVDDLLRGDTTTRATAYAQFRSAGVMTANEIRKLENLPALPGGDELSNPYTSTGTTAPPVDHRPKRNE